MFPELKKTFKKREINSRFFVLNLSWQADEFLVKSNGGRKKVDNQ